MAQRGHAARGSQRRTRAIQTHLDAPAFEPEPDVVAVFVDGVDLAVQVERARGAGVHLSPGTRLLMRSAPLNFHTA